MKFVILNRVKSFETITLLLLFSFCFLINLSFPVFSSESSTLEIKQRVETKASDIPVFHDPVCLLVGLSSSELSYREISSLSGFELFSVPYRADIKTLALQINPTQVIIKHPSGFTGLYSVDGQLIRGVETAGGGEVSLSGAVVPPSIIQPSQANSPYENLYYPGSATGAIPHGGLGYTPPPKGRNIGRHLLKIASLTGLVPFQYPGFFNAYNTTSQEKLFPALILPQAPLAIGALSTFVDAKLDESAYEQARTQPRDYMFQPVIEGY